MSKHKHIDLIESCDFMNWCEYFYPYHDMVKKRSAFVLVYGTVTPTREAASMLNVCHGHLLKQLREYIALADEYKKHGR